MASLRQIRSRLRSIGSTKQIMRAMQLVSASKLKRAQGRMLQARSMAEFLDELLRRVLAATGEISHPLVGDSPLRGQSPSLLVVFSSDAGLCGAYNANLIQLAEATLKRDTLKTTQLIFIGKKAHRYFTKRGYTAVESYLDLAGRPDLKKADAIARTVMERFTSGQVGSVHLLYAKFVSATTSKPTLLQWLPIELGQATRSPGHPVTPSEYIFEPSPQRVFEDLLPRWALAKFQLIMLEAFTAEHSARMIAMKNATDNAEEILKSLTLQRNKIRQAAITKELSEIVGTAEALK
ncbi:MAG: ATP synthase F1 subunit gamma [Candidatus Omnitrophica bacterium]|nr:ATP synthase F1 subunit gamma [Candidatus Omnitrophota bacterium]